MTNETSTLQFTSSDLTRAVKRTLIIYKSNIENKRVPNHDISDHIADQMRAYNLISPEKLDNEIENFLKLLLTLCTVNARDYPKTLMRDIYSHSRAVATLSISAINQLRSLSRFLLFKLWADGHLLLPITFSISRSLSRETVILNSPELLRFCLEFPPNQSKGSTHFRLSQHAPRWLMVSTWRKPEDIDLDTAIKINKFLLACKKGEVGFDAPQITTCVGLLIREAKAHFGKRIKYSQEDCAVFDKYFSRLSTVAIPFAEVQHELLKKDAAQKHQKEIRAERERLQASGDGKDIRKPNKFKDRDQIAPFTTDDLDWIIYKKRFESHGWFPNMSEMSFLPDRMSESACALWSGLFSNYIEYRKLKGLEDVKTIGSGLRVLAEYLSVCLPVSYFRDTATRVIGIGDASVLEISDKASPFKILPNSPREFTRFPFMDRRGDNNILAPTFGEYIRRRYPAAQSQYSLLGIAHKFFTWIALNYGDEDSCQVAGPKFKNPISKEFDLPRQPGKKARKTNKTPFSKRVLPHFITWLWAIERFGIYLQTQKRVFKYREVTVHTEEFGYVPFYRHGNRTFPILEFPKKLIHLTMINGKRYLQLSVLRMFITALEVGLRLQGAQWLDRKTFDSGNWNSGENIVYKLVVNTDKSNDGFTTPILRRVREMLVREQRDQERLPIEDVEIFYEDRPHTRFPKLVPLFRNPETNLPFTDETYDRAWQKTLESFQSFHSQNVGFVQFVSIRKPTNSKISYTKEGYEFTELTVISLYTPHSCRSTFITRRSPFLDLADVAEAVGVNSAEIASHYDYPEHDELGEKLSFADQAVMGESAAPAEVTSGPAFIKASMYNSSLQNSFRINRQETIRTFGMISLSKILNKSQESSGLESLINSQMSQIVFRDTHICPVGEQCPDEVISILGEARRCGICPIACKCIDHLTCPPEIPPDLGRVRPERTDDEEGTIYGRADHWVSAGAGVWVDDGGGLPAARLQ